MNPAEHRHSPDRPDPSSRDGSGLITKSGRDKLSAIVVGSDQGRELRISRSQVIQPGAFTTA